MSINLFLLLLSFLVFFYEMPFNCSDFNFSFSFYCCDVGPEGGWKWRWAGGRLEMFLSFPLFFAYNSCKLHDFIVLMRIQQIVFHLQTFFVWHQWSLIFPTSRNSTSEEKWKEKKAAKDHVSPARTTTTTIKL